MCNGNDNAKKKKKIWENVKIATTQNTEKKYTINRLTWTSNTWSKYVHMHFPAPAIAHSNLAKDNDIAKLGAH